MSFDPLARHYSWLEWVLAGRKLQLCRTAFLREAVDAQSALLVGEGHGRFLSELCRTSEAPRICYLDASSAMCAVAKDRLERAGLSPGHVEFVCLPVLQFESAGRFDLIATHFFLDCFGGDELREVVQKLANLLTPGGLWIISDFQVPRAGWRRLRARFVLSMAYAFFRVATKLPARRLAPPQQSLRDNGLVLEKRVEFNFGLLYGELWRLPVAPRRSV